MGSAGVPFIPALPIFTDSFQATASRFNKLQVASFVNVYAFVSPLTPTGDCDYGW